MKIPNKFSPLLKQFQRTNILSIPTLYALSYKSLTTLILFTILITIFLYTELSYYILPWTVTLIALVVFRLYNAYLYHKNPQRHVPEIWYKKFMIHGFVTGVMVSMLGFLFIHYVGAYNQLFILASLLGLTAGATTSLSSDFRIAITYISIIMIPLICSMMIIGTNASFILAVLMILFYISQIIMIHQSHVQSTYIRELHREKNVLKNLFSDAPIGMFSYDLNLNIRYANTALGTLVEYKNPTMTGVNLGQLFKTSYNIVSIFNATLIQGAQSYKGAYITDNNNELWVKLTVFPFKNTDGHLVGGLGIIEDKTKEYEDQKDLEFLYHQLQDEIKHNERLLDQNKQFIADMVHQIRTPLSVIMSNTSLIEMKNKSQGSPYITQINSAINMLTNSYEDLSYIISYDTIEYKPINIDFTTFLYDRIHFFEVIANANHKLISTDIANDISVNMNDIELERLIDNNLSNAIKHSFDKSEIEIILKKIDSEIILQFISMGKKIQNPSKLFHKNYTENHGAKRSLGLGLHMVKSICEKNHITYNVLSENDKNTFTYIFKG